MLQPSWCRNIDKQVDDLLSECDKEPIHTPGSIQPHGVLLVCTEPDWTVVQVSANTARYLGIEPSEVLNRSLLALFSEEQSLTLQTALSRKALLEGNNIFLFQYQFPGTPTKSLNVFAHRYKGLLIVELETVQPTARSSPEELMCQLKDMLSTSRALQDAQAFWDAIIHDIKRITGFDRVMVYEFEPGGHGSVIAEVKEAHLESYLGLHYPATDIPRQARELYLLNTLRVIPDINYEPVPIVPLVNPVTNDLPDLSFSDLRSVSPVHVKYLQNMGVSGTLTISIIIDNSLWGLIACHHYSPIYISYEVRTTLIVLARFISMECSLRLQRKEYLYQLELQSMKSHFIEFMARSETLVEALINFNPNIGDFIQASGAVICETTKEYGEVNIHTIGSTPTHEQIKALINWLQVNMTDALYSTDELATAYPPAQDYRRVASGMLAISLLPEPGNYVLWFRPEKIHTVSWAGDPTEGKNALKPGEVLTPRASFALWKETVKLKAEPWTAYEILAATEIRDIISRLLLLKTEELRERNKELESQVEAKTQALIQSNQDLEQFAIIASHDLQAPLRKVSQFSNFLMTNAHQQLSAENQDYLERIQKSVHKMQLLIDDLLQLSKVTRKTLQFSPNNLRDVIMSAIRDLEPYIKSCKATVHIGDTMVIDCDPMQLHQLFLNLIENAVKFHKPDSLPMVSISVHELDNNWCEILVSDNGIGFDEIYLDRIFKVFERLHGVSSFEGTGIGLNIVQRVVECHFGTVTARSKPGEGSTFIVHLPISQRHVVAAQSKAFTLPDV
jgi:chemotaxis family two-component system sensor kinase Cph1